MATRKKGIFPAFLWMKLLEVVQRHSVSDAAAERGGVQHGVGFVLTTDLSSHKSETWERNQSGKVRNRHTERSQKEKMRNTFFHIRYIVLCDHFGDIGFTDCVSGAKG